MPLILKKDRVEAGSRPAQLPAGEVAAAGNFFRPVHSSLTITGHGSCGTNPAHGHRKGRIPGPALCDITIGRAAMRIYGPNGTTPGTQPGPTRRTGASGFSLPDLTATAENRAAGAPKASADIGALLALQGIEEDPVERRRRSVQRGRGALDVLDELKLGLLSGNFDPATVMRLRAAAADLKSSSGDAGLDAVLSEIELRVEVELAKAGQC
jgi:hypothetical protein